MTMTFFQLVFWGVFVMGTVGLFLNRRNFVVMLMCIELMLLAVNTVFLT
jgi:NADH-quinone oxidoreductase subunit K